MNLRSVTLWSVSVLAAGIFVAGCTEDTTTPSKAKTVVGQEVTMGSGKVHSWISLDDAGNPSAIGLTFGEAALNGLATTPEEFTMTLPAEKSMTPFDHLTIDWNPNGHEPSQIYTLPHFDLHFYTITQAERAAITGGPDFITVDTNLYPAGFMTGSDTAFAVPNMGVHYVDANAGEFHGSLFDKTFIYGFTAGKLAFLEPMITKAYLEGRKTGSAAVSAEIKQPNKYAKTGVYYPTFYNIVYNAAAKEYTILLTQMVKR